MVRSIAVPVPDAIYIAVVQGIGSGAIQTVTEIIGSDLIALKDRGLFYGFMGACVLPSITP